jgi:hypothetical protein
MICIVSGLGRVKGLPGLRGEVDCKQIQTHQITGMAVDTCESKEMKRSKGGITMVKIELGQSTLKLLGWVT